MSTETAPQSRGGLKRHTALHPTRRPHGRERRASKGVRVERKDEALAKERSASTWQTRTCPCGRLFKVPPQSLRQTCPVASRVCGLPQDERRFYNEAEFKRKDDNYRAEFRSPKRLAYSREWKKRNRDKVQHWARLRYERVVAEPLARRAFLDRMYAQGYELRKFRNRPDPLMELDPETRAEVIALLEEQRKDDGTFQLQHAPSLDAWLEDEDDGTLRAANLGAVHFDREDDRWPFFAGRGTRRRTRASA